MKIGQALKGLAAAVFEGQQPTSEDWMLKKETWILPRSAQKGVSLMLPKVFEWYIKMQDALFKHDMEEEDDSLSSVKAELAEARKRIIQLQDELIDCKNNQLQALQSDVRTSVQSTVKEELRTFSAVVSSQPAPPIPTDTVKTLVKTVVEQEDRSKCVVMFGVPEEKDEGEDELLKKVDEVLLEVGEKPRVTVSRIGAKPKDPKKIRPVKVTVGSSVAAAQILAKSRFLSTSKKHSGVFISPDRSPSERVQHRLLVQQLRELKTSDPNKRHYIYDGKIVSADKNDKT